MLDSTVLEYKITTTSTPVQVEQTERYMRLNPELMPHSLSNLIRIALLRELFIFRRY
jgi:hypothetical protein